MLPKPDQGLGIGAGERAAVLAGRSGMLGVTFGAGATQY